MQVSNTFFFKVNFCLIDTSKNKKNLHPLQLDFFGKILHKLQIWILALISWYLDDWTQTRQAKGIIITIDGKQSYEGQNFQMFTCIHTYKCIHNVALHKAV